MVQKIPTPITPISMQGSMITKAFFSEKSTVDYIGAVQGIPVCFDAKECARSTFPLQNVHPHQVSFMERMEEQGGIAFLLILFTDTEECYYMRFQELKRFWDRAEDGGRKSVRREELDPRYYIEDIRFPFIPYLEMLSRDLDERED